MLSINYAPMVANEEANYEASFNNPPPTAGAYPPGQQDDAFGAALAALEGGSATATTPDSEAANATDSSQID
jgi:hypothetical protein